MYRPKLKRVLIGGRIVSPGMGPIAADSHRILADLWGSYLRQRKDETCFLHKKGGHSSARVISSWLRPIGRIEHSPSLLVTTLSPADLLSVEADVALCATERRRDRRKPTGVRPTELVGLAQVSDPRGSSHLAMQRTGQTQHTGSQKGQTAGFRNR